MDLLSSFKSYIREHNLFDEGQHLLLAVSGGVDSVVLAHLCFKAGFTFSVAHVNFKLSGEESDEDEKFVNGIAAAYQCPFFSTSVDTRAYMAAHKVGVQEAARTLRYQWFAEIISSACKHPAVLVTAHHADDNVETLLMNFFKGTGLGGLTGIDPRRGHIVRPLLFADKTSIEAYASEFKLAYRQDASNLSDKYTRNFYRHHIIPTLVQLHPSVLQNLQQNIIRFRDTHIIYKEALALQIKKLVTEKQGSIFIPALQLARTPGGKTILFEIIKSYNFSPHQLDDVFDLIKADSGKFVQSASHRILKNRKFLIISAHALPAALYVIEKGQKSLIYPAGELLIAEQANAVLPVVQDNFSAMVDAREIVYPMLLRKWKTGDYFYPLGMRKKKKLSRFFIDNKLSLLEKEQAWVLESDKRIVWILGMRIDDRFKITPSTIDVLKLHLSPAGL